MVNLFHLIRTWKLPVAMIIGVIIYYLFDATIPEEDIPPLYYFISHIFQPLLIFSMLFLSFLKVEPKELKPHRWHGILLLTQGSLFILCSLAAIACSQLSTLSQLSALNSKLFLEGAMLCFICPTATASAVIVQKLGGSLSGDVTYLVLVNLLVSFLAPCFMPLVEPHAGADFFTEFFMILGKVFPLLLCPLFLALIVRSYAPRLMAWMLQIKDLAFYMWLVALAFAITVTVKTIVESHIAIGILFGLAIVSAVCCAIQFTLGRAIGRHWVQPTKPKSQIRRFSLNSQLPSEICSVYTQPDEVTDHPLLETSGKSSARTLNYTDPVERSAITAGQAFGQKNTVFIIWMGLMFLNPITSVVGGFYSIWHNIVNSYQLYQRGKKTSEKAL